MEENMMKPLAPNDEGKPEVWCGFRGDKMKVAHPDDIMFKGLLSGMCPKSFGRKAHNSIGELIANGRGQMEWNAQGCPEKGSDFAEFNPLEDYSKMIELLHTGTKMIDQECISCTSSASARGLAKIAAMVANGGTFDGVEYISPEVWDEMHSEEYTHAQGGTGFVCSYTKGGLFVSQSNDEILKKCPEECKKLVGRNEQILSDGREGYYGWYGSGGPAIGHHKELKIGFGYVPNTLEMYDGYYRKTAEIQRAIKNCALAQNQKKI